MDKKEPSPGCIALTWFLFVFGGAAAIVAILILLFHGVSL